MKRVCLSLATIFFSLSVSAANSLHHPDECPKGIEGDYQAMAPNGVILVLTVAHDKDNNYTLTYHLPKSEDPKDSATIIVNGEEEKVDAGTITVYCKDSAIYHLLKTPDKSQLTKMTVVPEGIKVEGVEPKSAGGIYTRVKGNKTST